MTDPKPLIWLAAAALAAAVVQVPPQTASLAAQPTTLRFHHAHYRVGDPAAAMNETAKLLNGVRVVAQGLGVGVRAGSEFVLFDRLEDGAPSVGPAAPAAYTHVVERLRSWGFSPDPDRGGLVRVLEAVPDLPVDHLAFASHDFAAAVQRIEASGARVRARRQDSVIFDGGDAVAIEIVRDTDRAETFWCPMHPDVRSADAGKCPLCAMDLVPIPPPKVGEYKLDVHADRDRRSGTIRGLRFAVREPDTSAVVESLQVVHEKTFHLFIISRDLRFFDHVHPERRDDGSYELRQALPVGEYMLIADFLPVGGTSQMVQRAIVSGRPAFAAAAAPGAGEIVHTAAADGLRVTLEAGPMVAGKEVLLTFSVAEAQTGAPVTDLQPYLGAPAHMLIVRADLSDAIHAHPEEVATRGPTVSFHPLVPAAGDYKLWIQFQRAGRVVTVPFVLRAER